MPVDAALPRPDVVGTPVDQAPCTARPSIVRPSASTGRSPTLRAGGPRAGNVIENISVLFTDLVGSTELAAGLTREAGDALRRGHFSLLRRAIAGAGGSEVKNLGDGLMVVFPAASAALACAVAMQQAIERDNATA